MKVSMSRMSFDTQVPMSNFEVCWYCWNFVSQSVNNGIYNLPVKMASAFLIVNGSQSTFLQCLVNGNLLFPEDVILQALEREQMQRDEMD